MEGLLGKGMFTGIINFTLILINIMVVTVMWQKAGVPFNGAYTVVVLGSLVGTLLAVYYRVAVAVAPGIVINSFLCYDLVICQGYTWQEAMAVPVAAGLLLLLCQYNNIWGRVMAVLPDYLKTAIPASMGVLLIYKGLLMGRLVVGTPFQVTGMGSIYDPLTVITLVSLLAVLYFGGRGREQGLAIGLLAAGTMALAEGYVALPQYLFSVPEGFTDTAFQVNGGKAVELLAAVAAVWLVLAFDAMAAAKTMEVNDGRLFFINGLGTLLGGLLSGGAMTVAEVSAACGRWSKNPANSARVTAILLLAVLFCGPMMMELRDYPSVFAASVIGAGCYLLMDLKFLPINDNISILAGVFTIVLVPLWGSLTAGIGFGLIVYYGLRITRGR
jgi:xanthine/uracil/vitamin C permease (AzgA family)